MLVTAQYPENSQEKLLEVIAQAPLASLLWQHEDTIAMTHIPLVYCKQRNVFLGHTAKHNPINPRLLNGDTIQALFNGPDCYISPNDADAQVVPTWHFAKVTLTARAEVIHNQARAREIMAQTSSVFESAYQSPWQLEAVNENAISAMLNNILVFELHPIRLQGQFKLSQHKPKQLKQQLISSLQHRNELASANLITIE